MWDPKHNIVGTKERTEWSMHISRMAEDRLVRRVHDGIPDGKRNRGRPMKRWRDALEYTGHRPIRREEEEDNTKCTTLCLYVPTIETRCPLTSSPQFTHYTDHPPGKILEYSAIFVNLWHLIYYT